MKKVEIKRCLAILFTVMFLFGSVGFVDAKGSSSFGGNSGGRSSSMSTSSPSKSGFSTSGMSTPSKTYTPPTSSAAPSVQKPSSGSSWFGTSSGDKASANTPSKTGSVFGSSGKDAPVAPAAGASKTYTPPSQSSGGTTTVTNNRTTVIYRDRPSGWAPTYYYGSYRPSNDFFDLWWKLELLKTIQDSNERDRITREMRSDPNYYKWKAEADKVAAENKELKAQLASAEAVQATEDGLTIKPTKKSSHWFLWLLGILAICGIGYTVYRRNR